MDGDEPGFGLSAPGTESQNGGAAHEPAPGHPLAHASDEDLDDHLLDEDKGPNRRCIVSGEVRPIEELIRFVVGPDHMVVPDVEGRLPGRGIWLSARRDMVNTAMAKGLFARAARRKVVAPPDLPDRLERLLLKRCMDLLGLARRAGQAVSGFEKVKAELKAGKGAVLVAAADGAADGRDKIRALAPGLPLIDVLTSGEIGAAFGRDHVVHALLAEGRLCRRLLSEAGRFSGFRSAASGPG